MESLPQACKYNRHQCLRQLGTPTSLGRTPLPGSQSLLFRQSKMESLLCAETHQDFGNSGGIRGPAAKYKSKSIPMARPARLCTALPARVTSFGNPLVVLRPEHARLGLRFLPVCIVSSTLNVAPSLRNWATSNHQQSHSATHTARLYRQWDQVLRIGPSRPERYIFHAILVWPPRNRRAIVPQFSRQMR